MMMILPFFFDCNFSFNLASAILTCASAAASAFLTCVASAAILTCASAAASAILTCELLLLFLKLYNLQ